MTQPNRPTPRFQTEQTVWDPTCSKAVVLDTSWQDGEWTYAVKSPTARAGYLASPRWYAEHELTEAGR